MNFTNCGITSQDWYTMNEIISDIYTLPEFKRYHPQA